MPNRTNNNFLTVLLRIEVKLPEPRLVVPRHEGRVNVLEQEDGVAGEVRYPRLQHGVRHGGVGEVEHGDAEAEVSGQGEDEAGLAAARGSVQQHPPPVGYPPVSVPGPRPQEPATIPASHFIKHRANMCPDSPLAVRHECVHQAWLQHHAGEGAGGLRAAQLPPVGPGAGVGGGQARVPATGVCCVWLGAAIITWL